MNNKLSDLIFLGAKKSPKVERGWTGVSAEGKMETCAISAAAEECGLLTQGPDGKAVWNMRSAEGGVDRLTGKFRWDLQHFIWPEWFARLLDIRAIEPCDCGKRVGAGTVGCIIKHLHDVHGWSREATAMWVESVEKAIETALANPCPGWGGRAPVAAEVGHTVKV